MSTTKVFLSETPEILGAHMSVEGGLFRALERGHSIGCNTIQIFTRNASRWAAKDVSTEEASLFRKARRAARIAPVFAHCSYLINLGCDGEFYERSIDALTAEVIRAEQLALNFVVLHPGSHRGCGEEQGLRFVVCALNQVFERTYGMKCKIAIENTAGQGNCLGSKIEHLQYIVKNCADPNRIGVCIDTCHFFAAGYDIRTKEAYNLTFQELLSKVPLRKIFAFHLNDSKKQLQSNVDRHEHIGKGHLGVEAFRLLLNDPRFKKIPKVLETPKGKDLAEDVVNLALLRSLSQRREVPKP
ncbi:MAG TPA: deoxyribonuclease IV [Acidobacteriota bacterium]|nr:deoxyribonuclease IV [Acidobacteriota bacterium]